MKNKLTSYEAPYLKYSDGTCAWIKSELVIYIDLLK